MLLARKLRNESTLSEILLWKKIKGKTFGYEFHRQVPINEYIVDFYCHELKLAIEIDGSSHDYDEIYKKDKIRQQILESFGVKVLRILDIDVKKDMNNVLRVIEATIDELSEDTKH